MKRHEMMRQQYRDRRYMEYLSDTELQKRAKDILLNHVMLTDKAKIGLVPLNNGGSYWSTLFIHVLEEFNLRFGPYPAGFPNGFTKELRIPDPRSPIASKAAEVVRRQNLQPGKYLIKYGKLCHIRDALKHGAIRIFPALGYDDPSLNLAIQDDELQLSIQAHPSFISLTNIDKETMQPIGVKPIGNVTITQQSQTDYYVYCLSSSLAPRLFLDFDYDACLIITNPQRFIVTLLSTFKEILPNLDGIGVPVTYVDPLDTKELDIDVFCCKHFRFAYQKEYRVIWLPPTPVKKLEPIDVKLCSLEDYCELIPLSR